MTTIQDIKARRQMADCALGDVHWEWSYGMLDDGRQAFFGLYAYNSDKSARVEIMSPSQGHIDIDPTEAHFIAAAPADIDYLLAEVARLQAECEALKAQVEQHEVFETLITVKIAGLEERFRERSEALKQEVENVIGAFKAGQR